MPLPSDFLTSLVCPPTKDLIEMQRTEPTPSGGSGAYLEIKNEVRPVDLFCYLGARFGPPNGIQNLLRNDHSDNLVHWDWSLRFRDIPIYLWGTNFRTDLIVGAGLSFGELEKQELIEQIRSDLKNYGPQMSEVRGRLEQWTEFVNPYWRLTRAIKSLRKELDSLNLQPSLATTFATLQNAVERQAEWKELGDRYNKAFGLCFGIRSMLPVSAEAFINLLIYVLARKDIKADSRLLDNTFRQQIDIRVKSLHINCSGFEQPIDYAHTACKRFHTLINERNDLLHGNVLPEKQKFNEVFFLGTVPVFKEYRSLWDRTLAVDIEAVGLSRLTDEVATVDAFVEYVLSCLNQDVRQLMTSVVNERDMARNHENGRFGILFPHHLVDSRPVFSQADDRKDRDA